MRTPSSCLGVMSTPSKGAPSAFISSAVMPPAAATSAQRRAASRARCCGWDSARDNSARDSARLRLRLWTARVGAGAARLLPCCSRRSAGPCSARRRKGRREGGTEKFLERLPQSARLCQGPGESVRRPRGWRGRRG